MSETFDFSVDPLADAPLSVEQRRVWNLLRGELLAGFNSILGNAAVQEVYFTEFAIQ